jgi:hypothetical protein
VGLPPPAPPAPPGPAPAPPGSAPAPPGPSPPGPPAAPAEPVAGPQPPPSDEEQVYPLSRYLKRLARKWFRRLISAIPLNKPKHVRQKLRQEACDALVNFVYSRCNRLAWDCHRLWVDGAYHTIGSKERMETVAAMWDAYVKEATIAQKDKVGRSTFYKVVMKITGSQQRVSCVHPAALSLVSVRCVRTLCACAVCVRCVRALYCVDVRGTLVPAFAPLTAVEDHQHAPAGVGQAKLRKDPHHRQRPARYLRRSAAGAEGQGAVPCVGPVVRRAPCAWCLVLASCW